MTVRRRRLTGTLLTVLWLSGSVAIGSELAPTASERLDEVWTLVRDHFYDPDLGGLDWPAVGDRYRRLIGEQPDATPALINAMLAELRTSHTRYLTADEAAYYQLLAIFEPHLRETQPQFFVERFADGPIRYSGIGVLLRRIGDRAVVSGVLAGQPAAAAGVLRGDVLLRVDGEPFRDSRSFAGKVGRTVTLTVERHADQEPLEIAVTPRQLEPATLFLDAMRASAQVVDADGVDVAYVHVWSYAGSPYQRLLEELVRSGGPLAEADALVLDIRDGWGGASSEYLNLFNRDLPSLTIRGRGGDVQTYDTQWRKPVVLLIDGGSRSGKETLAFGFRRYRIGPVVGSRTAGAVVAGGPYLLADGSLLFLAVADVEVDGERLEGRGVAPDIEIEDPLMHAAGADPQLDRALAVAAARAREGEGL